MFSTNFSIAAVAVNQRKLLSPASLAPAAWFDPSDRSTLFQDVAMTIPVTADGQPVGAMLDKSENGYDFFQSETLARPIYHTNGTRHWVESDGVNHFLIGSHRFGLTTNPALTVTGGLRFVTMDDGIAMAIGGGASAGALGMLNVGIGNNGLTWRHGDGYSAFGTIQTGEDAVLSWHRANGTTYENEKFACNGVELPLTSVGHGTVMPSNIGDTATLFSQNSLSHIQCRLYSLIVQASNDPAKIAAAEAWTAQKAGIGM